MIGKTEQVRNLSRRLRDDTQEQKRSGRHGWFNYYSSFYEASSPTLQSPIKADIDLDNPPDLPDATSLQNHLHKLIITLIRLQAMAKDHEHELSPQEIERLSLEAMKATELFQGSPRDLETPFGPEETARNTIQSLEIKHQKRRADQYFGRAQSYQHDLDKLKSAHMVSRTAYHINHETAEALKRQIVEGIENPSMGLLDRSIKRCNIPINAAQKKALNQANINNLADLCKSSQWDLIKINGIGSVTIEKIADWLEQESIPALCRINISRIGMIDHGAYAVNASLSNGIISPHFLWRLNTDQEFQWFLPSAIAPDTEFHFPLNNHSTGLIELHGNPAEPKPPSTTPNNETPVDSCPSYPGGTAPGQEERKTEALINRIQGMLSKNPNASRANDEDNNSEPW